MISKELLEELKMIIKEDYQIELQLRQVSEIGNTLVGFLEILAKVDYQSQKGDHDG